MTATINHTCDKTGTPLTRDEVKKMLRDAAYVLHLTRRVKAAGEHWVVQEKKGRKIFSKGVWAPASIRRH